MIRPEELTERSSARGNLMTGAERWFKAESVSDLSKADFSVWEKHLSGKPLTELQRKSLNSIEKRLKSPVEPKLSEGAKTHLQNRFMGDIFSYQKSITSKAMSKGNEVEARAISQLGEYLGYAFLRKNENHLENEWSHGTPDALPNDKPIVFDAKCVWEPVGLKVFSKKNEDLIRTYTWQIKDYCFLTGRDHGAVARILMSLPESQLQSVARSHWIDAGGTWRDEIPESFLNEVRDMYDFEAKRPFEDRLSLTYIPFLKDDDRRIIAATELAREYWEELITTFSKKNIYELKMLGYESGSL